MRTEPGRGRVAQAIRAVPPSKDGVLQNGGARGDPEESLERTASRGWRTRDIRPRGARTNQGYDRRERNEDPGPRLLVREGIWAPIRIHDIDY